MSVEIVKHKKQEAYVSHVEKDGTFFLQLDTSEASTLDKLSDQIRRHVKSAGSQNIRPAFGFKCFARSNADKLWYRALIVGVDDSKVTVFYVDYGNVEIVSLEQLRDPVDSFFNSCYQSVCCTSANFSPKQDNFGSKLKSLIIDREICCVFLSKNKSKGHPFLHFLPCYNVLLYEDMKSDVTLAEVLVQKNLGMYSVCAGNAEIGSKKNVVVSFVDSPGKFWVQLSENVEVLTQLMDNLNSPTITQSLDSLPDTSIDKGVICCALYPDDLQFYRAEISGRKSNTKVEVWFGDFGNSQVVATKYLKILPCQFTRFPFCALMCSLDGVLPLRAEKPHPRLGNIAWTPEASKSFSSLTLEEEFRAHFVNELSPDVYTVHLFDLNTGIDVRTVLAKKGIVELSVPFVQNTVNFESLSLSVGKTYENVFITHVESPAVVWCQLPQYQEKMEALTTSLKSIAPTLPALEKIEVGVPCCAQYSEDNAWYRGTIENVNSNAGTAQVLFVDYGNSEEVLLSSLKAVSSDYLALPAQAVSFSMNSIAPSDCDDWNVETCELFVNLVFQKVLDCTVVCLDNDGYPSVNLFDPQKANKNIGHYLVQQGWAVEVSSPDLQPLNLSKDDQPIYSSEGEAAPVDFNFLSFQVGKSYQKVIITHVKSPAEVWCQLPRYQKEMKALTNKLQSLGPTLPVLEDIEVGVPCCSQYSVDKAWYRGTIENVNSVTGTAQVLFVDYGNSEEVQLTCLKVLSSDSFALPAQATSFSLSAIIPIGDNWSDEACDFFINLVHGKILDCSVVGLDADGYPAVELYDPINPTQDIAQHLLQKGLAIKMPSMVLDEPQHTANQKNKASPVDSEGFSLEVGKSYTNIYISHVESPSVVWCQLLEYQDKLNALSTALESVSPNSPMLSEVEVGILCCAQYSVDNGWYRCTIQNVNSVNETAQVLFVDYGNSEEVLLTSLRTISSDYVALPALAVSFSIQTVAPIDGDWSQEACNLFANLVQEKVLNCTVIVLDVDGYPSVKLCDPQNPDQDVCHDLVRQGYAIEVYVDSKKSEQAKNSTALLKPPSLSQLLDFELISFEVGKSYKNIFITHVESPAVLWCQLPQYQEDMELLTAKLESVGPTLPALDDIEVGVPCCAQYSGDKAWYRGTIESVNTATKTAQVLFVDFGNSEKVQFRNLKALSSDYFALPAQAVSFSMVNIVPPIESEWNEESCEFFAQRVYEKELTCEVVKFDADNYPAVLLFDSERSDIGQELVSFGYAKYCCSKTCAENMGNENTKLVPSGAPISSPKRMTEEVLTSSISYNATNLAVGSMHSVIVCHVESLTEFYCQLTNSSSDLEDMMKNICRYCESSNLSDRFDNLIVGEPIIANFSKDGGWYRALILEIKNESNAVVKFIDYGNFECTSINLMKKIPEAFLKLPALAIQCSLYDATQNASAFNATAKFQDLTLDHQFMLSVKGTGKDGQIFAELKCEDETTIAEQLFNCGLIDTRLDPECFCEENTIPSPVFPVNSPTSVVPCFIESAQNFYLQLTDNYQLLKTFIDSIDSFYKAHEFEVPKQSIGCIYAVRFSEDGVWYRARITVIHDDEKIDVKFLDYGNSETTTMASVRSLHSTFLSTPCFAVQCFLDGLPKDVAAIDTEAFIAMISDQELVAEFCSQLTNFVSPVAVKLTSKGVNVLKSFCRKNVLLCEEMLIPNLPSPDSNTSITCVVSFVASCEEFYCQLSEFDSKFQELMDNLYTFYGDNKGTLLAEPAVGLYCAVPFGNDCSWYRGVITYLNESSASVVYLDYGNIGDVKLSDLMKLELQFCSLPVQALLCCLPQQYWNAECSETFQAMFEQSVEVKFVKQLSNGTYMTDLKFNDRTIDSIFGTSSPASFNATPGSTNVQSVVPDFDLRVPIIVTYVASCAEFFCQLLANNSEFDALKSNLSAFYTESGESQVLASPDVGQLCATTFGTDGVWYRAKITAVYDNDAQVFYVDYGNSGTVPLSDVKKLEAQFHNFPLQALKCCLKNFTPADDEGYVTLFQELVLQHKSEALFEQLVEGDWYSITVFVNEQNVIDMLTKFDITESVQLFSPNLGAHNNISSFLLQPGSTYDVLVTLVNSSAEFYCQLVDVEQKLDSLMLKIRSVCEQSSPCTEWCENEYVFAKYVEDEEWYRAQIIHLNQDGSSAKVYYLDYGNFDTVKCTELRKVTPELCELPAQALKCSVESSQSSVCEGKSVDQWSEWLLNQKLPMKCLSVDGKNTHVMCLLDLPHEVDPVVDVENAMVALQINSNALISQSNTEALTLSQEDLFPYPEIIQPILGESYSMFVSHINSPSQFWLQMPTAVDVLAVLQNDLEAAYEGKEKDVLVNPRGACCAKFSEDDCWYRAVIQKQLQEGLLISFVDFGNSEIVNTSLVLKLRKEFLKTPVQAIECSLSELVDTNFSNEILAKFSDLVVNKELVVSFKEKIDINKWKVSIHDCGQNIVEKLSEAASPSKLPTKEFSSPVSIKSLDINVGEVYSVYVAFSDSPSKFFCQLKSECEKLELLMSDVSSYYNCSLRGKPVLLPGLFCVAQYPDNGLWYRAQIVSVHSNSDIEVNFVDYGNCEHVCADQICVLVEEFSLLAAQGIPCSLLHDYNVEFTGDVLQQFFQYDLNQEFKVKIRAFHEKRYIVDLYDQEGSYINASVLGLLLSPSHASLVDTNHYIPTQLDIGSSVQAYISHIDSPTSFYCQPLEQADELECLMNDISLMSLSVSPLLISKNISLGNMCLVQYSKDNEWYRALVKSVENSIVSVLFVDYGNTEVTSVDKMAEMTERLQSYVTQAVHCSVFEGLDSNMRWSEEQTSQFREQISQSDHITMKVSSVSSHGQYIVDIKINGNNVDFSSLLEQQMEESVPLTPPKPQRSLTAGPSDLIALAIEGSAAGSTSIDTGSEGGDTESDNESVGKPLIKAPYKLSLAVHESLDVNVVFVHSPSLLYVQRADCKAVLESLSEEIKQYCTGFGDSLKEFSLNFHQGDYVLAKHSSDSRWYRAEVTGVDSKDGSTEVLFIDYGNTEVIPSEDLVVCPENILELPAQAISCSLAQVPRRDSWPFEYKKLIHQLVDNKVLRATVILPASQGMRPTVKLENKQTNTDLADQVLLKLQEECENDSNDIITELSEGEDSEANSLSNTFQSDVPISPTPTSLDVGSALVETQLASTVEINKSYSSPSEDQSDIQITENPEIDTKEVYSKLNLSTDTINPLDNKLSLTVVEEVESQSTTSTLIEAVSLDTSADNRNSSESASCLLSEDKEGILSGNEETAVNTNNNNRSDRVYKADFTSGTRFRVKVSHVSSPDDFLCVLTENDNILKQIATEIADDNPPVSSSVFSGLPVGVFSKKYNEWCRAKVLCVEMPPSVVKLYLMDKGDTEIAQLSQLKLLAKKHIESLPPQALRCRLCLLHETDLHHNTTNTVPREELWDLKWPVCCSDHFQSLTKNNSDFLMEICSISDDNIYEITLLDSTSNPFLNIRQLLVENLCLCPEITVSPLRSISHEKSFESARNLFSLSTDESQEPVEMENLALSQPASPEYDLISFEDVGQSKELLNQEEIDEPNKCLLRDIVPSKLEAVTLKPTTLRLTSIPTPEDNVNFHSVFEREKDIDCCSVSCVDENTSAIKVDVLGRPSIEDN